MLIGNFLETMRISTGDFSVIGSSIFLSDEENIIFWLCWTIIVGVTCIIFLNFIIAEASESYNSVKSRLKAMISKEKASLISEAEDMTFMWMKSNKLFPKYIVIRELSM